MKIIQCKICKGDVKVSPKIEKSGRGKYCSRECYYASIKPLLLKKQCSNCRKVFEVPKWREYAGKRVWLCNSKCWSVYRKEHPGFYKQYSSRKMISHPVLTKQLLEKEYVKNGLKMKDIAVKYGYGYVTVNSWIHKYKIKTRIQADYLEKTTFGAIARELRKQKYNTCELCGWNKATCDVHHKIKQCDNGTHDKSNLIVLCPNCHRMVSEGKLMI